MLLSKDPQHYPEISCILEVKVVCEKSRLLLKNAEAKRAHLWASWHSGFYS